MGAFEAINNSNKNNSNESNIELNDKKIQKIKKSHGFYMLKEGFENTKPFSEDSYNNSYLYTNDLTKLTPEQCRDREFMKNKMNETIQYGNFLDESLKSNKDFIKDFVKSYPGVINYASVSLKNNMNFIVELLKINKQVFPYLQHKISYDKQTIYKFIERKLITLCDIQDEFLLDFNFVSKILKIDPEQIIYVIDIFDDIYHLVKIYIKQFPKIIKYIDKKYLDNVEFLKELLESNPHFIKYLDNEHLEKIHDSLIEAIRKDGSIVDSIYEKNYSKIKELVLESINENTDKVPEIALNFLYDKEILIRALEKDSSFEKYVKFPMFFDKDIIRVLEKIAIKKFYIDKLNTNYATYYYFPKEMKKDKDIIEIYNYQKNKYT